MPLVILILETGMYFGQPDKPYTYETPELAQQAVNDLCICTDRTPECFQVLPEAEAGKKAS